MVSWGSQQCLQSTNSVGQRELRDIAIHWQSAVDWRQEIRFATLCVGHVVPSTQSVSVQIGVLSILHSEIWHKCDWVGQYVRSLDECERAKAWRKWKSDVKFRETETKFLLFFRFTRDRVNTIRCMAANGVYRIWNCFWRERGAKRSPTNCLETFRGWLCIRCAP